MTVTLELTQLEHVDYTEFKARWKMIRDVIAGKEAIDKETTTYVPRPKGYDDDSADERYLALLVRAVLYNATARTLDGYLGAIFRKEAEVALPKGLEYLNKNADGQGNNLEQFSKRVCRDVISIGRHGVLVDYPTEQSTNSLEEERNKDLKAHFASYTPETIVNWATKKVGATTVLTHVMLLESRTVHGSGNHVFSRSEEPIYRLLELDDSGHYIQRTLVSVKQEDKKGNEITFFRQEGEVIKPKLRNGEPLNYIPFVFVGSETFTPTPDLPPLYDLAQLNIAHYRNSADWEHAVFMVGQPTPWIAGVDDTFIEENKGHLVTGSGNAWLLPEGAMVGLLESSQDKNIIKAAMEEKKSEMIGLGARIIQDNSSRGSEATESVQLRRSGEASQLSCIADNVSEAMVLLFTWAAAWMDIEHTEEDIKYKLNKDFFAGKLSAQDMTSLVLSWQSGAISHDVLLNNFRKGEIVSELMSNEDVKNQIEEDGPPLGMMGEDINLDEEPDEEV